MRAGNCAVQQALTTEASTIVKQAVALAKRRGHAQVTPLHVANTMLSSPTGLLRVACLQSHSHPLQCKALELCFNVALNRLPATSSSPIITHHSQYPSISNALVAAFKRAQAHQRRGSVENQQQPILAVKIELEQLIISILDDPSVSRVMREAGFSSTQVKCNVEKAVTLELCSSQSSPPNITHKSQEQKLNTKSNPITDPIRDEDVSNIIETLLSSRRKQSIVVVGECVSTVENTVKGLMERVDKGTVPDELKEVKFISIPPLYSFCNLRREEVEQKIGELTCLVKSLVSRGVVLYLGDLKWISDYRVNLEQEKSYYCSVEHVIMELGRLACGIGEIGKFWLMGIATFQTYMRCRTGHHSLENVWGLFPVTIPANSLGLSLISQSDEANGAAKLSCCTDCTVKFEAEARSCGTNEPTLSKLPPWLKDESRRISSKDQSREHSIKELCKKWNSYCTSTHRQPQSNERTLTFSSTSPSSSTSCFSFDQHNPNFLQKHFAFSSNPNSTPNSTSSSDIMDTNDHYTKKFKEFNSENLKTLCSAIEKNVPWQKELIPEIAGTVLQCRSKMLKRKDNLSGHISKEETWLFFLGPDVQAKEKISRDLAKVVFGSYSDFITVGLNSSSFISSSSDDCRNKRGRDEQSCSSYIERFSQAVCANPHRVFFVEDLDLADYKSRLGMKSAIEKGRICNANGDEVGLSDAIVVFSCERFRSCRSRGCSPSSKQKMEEERSGCVFLDLNISFDEGQNRHVEDDQSFDELGILENVDRVVNFNIQEL